MPIRALLMALLAGAAPGPPDPNAPIVRVNGEPISHELVRAELKRRFERVALRELIEERLLLQEARRLKVKVDEREIGRRVQAARGGLTAGQARREWLLDELSRQLTVVSEADIRLVYQSNRGFYVESAQVRLRDLVVASADEAEQLHQLLTAGGGDFAQLARTFSTDQASRAGGGDLGWLPLPTLVPALREAAARLRVGELSLPLEVSGEWHLLKLEARRAERQKPLTEVRGEIQRRLRAEQQPMTRANLLEDLRRRARIHPPTVVPD